MSKKVSRIIGGIMLILAVAFLFVALGHPGRVDKVVDKSEVFRYSIFSTCAI